jgi:hypothetical protein
MTVALSGQNIVVSGAGATHTWADVIALGSTHMTTITQSDGKTLYRWKGILTVRDTATLNIYDQVIEIIESSTFALGVFCCADSGVINFGQLATIGSSQIAQKGCEVLVTINSFAYGSGADKSALTFSRTNEASTTGRINFYGSRLSFSANGFSAIYIYKLYLSNFIESDFFNHTPDIDSPEFGGIGVMLSIQSGGTFAGSKIKSASLSPDSSSTISDLKMITPQKAVIALQSGLNISGINVVEPTYSYDIYDNSSVYFIDSGVDLTKGAGNANTGTTPLAVNQASQYLKIISGGSAISNAFVAYSGRTNASATTSAGGLVNFKLNYQETNIPVGTGGAISTPIAVVDYSSYTRSVRSYPHLALIESISVNSPLGSSANPYTVSLLADVGVTQANTTTVAAYTGIACTTTTASVSGTRTLPEIYDFAKLHWRNNGGVAPSLSVTVADFGARSLSFSGSTVNAGTKFRDGLRTSSGNITIASPSALSVPIETTSGTVTLSSTGSYAALSGMIGSGAIVVVTGGGTTNLQGWTFEAGAQITRDAGSATVIVDPAQIANITAGTGVTLLLQSTLTLTGFPNGSRVVISQSGRTQDLVNGQNSPYTFTGPAGGYGVVISAAGYKDLVLSVDLSTSRTIPVSLIAASSSQEVDQSLARFIQLMRADSRYAAILTEALAVSALRDEAYTVRLGLWSSAEFKVAWNALIASSSITDPTSGEVAAWTGYLLQSGYAGISFTSAGGIN